MAHSQKNNPAAVAVHEPVVNQPARLRLDPLSDFDRLPNAAHVRLPVVLTLFACSPATVWRHVKTGHIPAPVKIGKRMTAWRVETLRKHLSMMN